jgi:tRNA pseudouridine65 synthase
MSTKRRSVDFDGTQRESPANYVGMENGPSERPVVVLYRDDSLLVLSKPSGLLVHRGWGRDRITLVDLVRDQLDAGKVHPAHRLDRGTSGTVLFALDPTTAAAITESFERGEVVKTYLALVRGRPPDRGEVDHPLPRRPDGPTVPARTEYRRLHSAATEPRHVSLVEAATSSGRLHQVRRHLKHISHPLIGDANYGKGPLNRAFEERYGLARLALHAHRLELIHPASGQQLAIEAPLPDDLGDPLARMGFPESLLPRAQS